MFIIAAGVAVTRWTLLFLFPSTPVFIFTQIFHSLTYGLTSLEFIDPDSGLLIFRVEFPTLLLLHYFRQLLSIHRKRLLTAYNQGIPFR